MECLQKKVMLDIKDIFLNSDEYYHTEYNKSNIYLHHTAGGCFVGNTMVTLVNGNDVRIDSLEKNKEYWLYGCDRDGTTKIVKCVFLGETKKVDKIVEVTLDNGNIERCTLEHLWMMRDGTYKTANNLKSGDSLMPLYKRFDKRGYEEIKNNDNYKWYKTHQLSGKLKYGENIYKSKIKNIIHHIDFNKLNNEPDNLVLMEKNEHSNEISYKEYKETYNHKVVNVNIVDLKKSISVYDFYSPETNNFALSSGVFVHNSRPDWVVGMWDKDSNSSGSIRHIATSFIIGGRSTRNGDETWDGVTVRCFPESKWAWHLGVKGTKGKFDKISIGIEICNYGSLTKGRDGSYYNYVNSIVPETEVVKLPNQFRGFEYYHKYTDNQIESVRKLLFYLSNKFNINLRMGLREWIEKESLVMPTGISIIEQQKWLNRYGFVGKNGKSLGEDGVWGNNTTWAVQSIGKSAFEYNPLTLNGYPGIWSHGNVRSDKFDVSPQPNLIAMLKSL